MYVFPDSILVSEFCRELLVNGWILCATLVERMEYNVHLSLRNCDRANPKIYHRKLRGFIEEQQG